jgi:hypothetical protein
MDDGVGFLTDGEGEVHCSVAVGGIVAGQLRAA